jgi:hypothetical protein
MKTRTIKILAVVLMLLIVLLVVLYNMLGTIVRTAVETAGPDATGSAVSLADVDIRLLSGKVGLGGFVIGNPEGFQSDSAFKLGKFAVNFDVGTIRNDVIIIESILIDSAEITWEGWRGDNHRAIMRNIESYSSSTEAEEKQSDQEEPKPSPARVIIQDFRFQNSAINVVIAGTQIAELEFPELHVTGIGSQEGGVTVEEAVQQQYRQIFASLSTSVANNRQMLNQKAAELEADGKKALRDTEEALKKGDVEGLKQTGKKAKKLLEGLVK